MVRAYKNIIPINKLQLLLIILITIIILLLDIIINSVVSNFTDFKDILCPNLPSKSIINIKFKPLKEKEDKKKQYMTTLYMIYYFVKKITILAYINL